MVEPTNQPNITAQDEAHIAKDDRAIMRLAVDLAAKCVSEENRVSPKVAAVVVRQGVGVVQPVEDAHEHMGQHGERQGAAVAPDPAQVEIITIVGVHAAEALPM